MTGSLFDVSDRPPVGSAVIDPTGQYRYRLDRWWGPGVRMPFCMLNPSTADASEDDPTIRRCIGFARREGFDGITVVNIGAFRATEPKNWAAAEDPIGPENFWHIAGIAVSASLIVAAWGAHPLARESGAQLVTNLWLSGIKVYCLGTTKDGSPRHPLYVRSDQPLVEL